MSTIKRRNTAEPALIDSRVGQRQNALEHSLLGIPRIVIPMDAVWLGIAGLPRWGETARIQRHAQSFSSQEDRPDLMQVRMLPNVPLRLMSPDRHEIARFPIIIGPPRRIVDRDPKLGFEDLDEPVAKLDRDRLVNADPTELAEMGNIEGNAHRALLMVKAATICRLQRECCHASPNGRIMKIQGFSGPHRIGNSSIGINPTAS